MSGLSELSSLGALSELGELAELSELSGYREAAREESMVRHPDLRSPPYFRREILSKCVESIEKCGARMTLGTFESTEIVVAELHVRYYRKGRP